jgi:hypothetical protein
VRALHLRPGLGLGGQGGPAFNPAAYASVLHWLRADDVTFNGSAVSRANDKSGNARHWSQTVPGVQPGYVAADPVANGRPAITFDSLATQYFDGWNMAALNPAVVEAFLVLRINTNPPPSSLRRGLWNTNFAANDALYPHSTGIRDNLGSSALKLSTLPAVQTLLLPHVYGVNAQAGEWTSRINGVQHFTTATNTMLWQAAPWLGRSTATNHLDGRIYEWILLAEKLAAPVRAIFHAYFASRYAIAVTP